jgi:ParB family chromosome partitioning protein
LIGGAGRESLPPLHAALDQVHYQGVALPHLIAQKDLEGLRAAAANRALPQATRLGALEALAVLASAPAEEALAQIGRSDAEEEELRMAAWRALRRSKRTRQKAKVKA